MAVSLGGAPSGEAGTAEDDAEEERLYQEDCLEQEREKYKLIFSGIPENGNEISPHDKFKETISRYLSIDLINEDIPICMRIKSRKQGGNRDLLVKFRDMERRDKIYSRRREVRHVYVNECLTKRRSEIVSYAQHLKREGQIAFVATQNSNVIVKLNEQHGRIQIKSVKDLRERVIKNNQALKERKDRLKERTSEASKKSADVSSRRFDSPADNASSQRLLYSGNRYDRDTVEQDKYKNDLSFGGVAEENEDGSKLKAKVIDMLKEMDFNIDDGDIMSCVRAKVFENGKRNVYVSFRDQKLRNRVFQTPLSKRLKLNLVINERLTDLRRDIFNAALSLRREQKITGAYTQEGKVYVRVSRKTIKAAEIKSVRDLRQLVEKTELQVEQICYIKSFNKLKVYTLFNCPLSK